MRKFQIGDRVTVKNETTLFHTRIQAYTRGKTGIVAAYRPSWVIPEDEAWGRAEGRTEPFYVIRFNQRDLWPEYRFVNDTLETEIYERWLMPAKEDAK
jgi:hypothetical protein